MSNSNPSVYPIQEIWQQRGSSSQGIQEWRLGVTGSGGSVNRCSMEVQLLAGTCLNTT
jgi:hypothetical protein